MPLILKVNTVIEGYQYIKQYLKMGVELTSKTSCEGIAVYIDDGKWHNHCGVMEQTL
jgi:hypothetical protein